MPNRFARFRDDWLDLEDKNKAKISEWCQKGNYDYSAYCSLCQASINIGNSGKIQLLQHSGTAKHKKLYFARKDTSQTRFVFGAGKEVSLETPATSLKKPWTLNPEDKISKSEIIWTIHAALSNYSFLSHDPIKQVFTTVFPDSQLGSSMTLCSTKVSYCISHGLGPYFLKKISDEFVKEKPFFTLMFDETLNEQNLMQLDVLVRYWSSKNSNISERYIGS